MPTSIASPDAKTRLLDAALHVIRAKGFSATRIEDICAAAGLTKGGFFHHFRSKEDLALSAARHFTEQSDAAFASAPYQAVVDPLQRLLAYVDFRIAMIDGDFADFTCLFGTMVQETYDTVPAIRDACNVGIRSHASDVARIIADAKRQYAPRARWSADGLALHIQGAVQGAFVLAKAGQDPRVATDSLRHLRRYLELLFTAPPKGD